MKGLVPEHGDVAFRDIVKRRSSGPMGGRVAITVLMMDLPVSSSFSDGSSCK